MGLDITAYRQAAMVHRTDDGGEHDHYPEPIRRVYPNEHFPKQADGIGDACYSAATEFGFRAGSYSGYNRWRDELCEMALGVTADYLYGHVADFDGRPFVDLINFSDCEGVIGPKTSAKLVRDFRDYHEKAEAFARAHADGEYFLAKYRDWAKAFYLASDGGFVDFH